MLTAKMREDVIRTVDFIIDAKGALAHFADNMDADYARRGNSPARDPMEYAARLLDAFRVTVVREYPAMQAPTVLKHLQGPAGAPTEQGASDSARLRIFCNGEKLAKLKATPRLV